MKIDTVVNNFFMASNCTDRKIIFRSQLKNKMICNVVINI
jgi:hypothetical protein